MTPEDMENPGVTSITSNAGTTNWIVEPNRTAIPTDISIPSIFGSTPIECKPHKCPVCEGSARVNARLYDPKAQEGTAEVCKACEKGIVWG